MTEVKGHSVWRSYRFPVVLLLSIVIGSVLGLILGKRATVLQPLGDVFLNLMFTIVVPLVLVTVTSAVASMANLRRLGKILGTMLAVFIITGLIAAVITTIVVVIYPPAKGVKLELSQAEEIQLLKTADQIVRAFTVNDFQSLLSRRNMMPLIVFSILLGLSISLLKEKAEPLVKLLNILSEAMIKMISIIMYYAPIGLGAYFAALVGDFGPQLLGAYGRAMLVYYPLSIVYFFIAFAAYSYFAAGKEGTKKFFKAIFEPAITALATQSSLATLPVNLKAAKRLGVPKDIREIVLPVGATMHMDGSCISAILKISFLFGIFGMPFSGIGTFVTAFFVAVLSGVVMSGVPGGGLIGEMLIVSLYGFPPEAFPIIAMIGYLVDPPATMVNATGDTVAAMMVTRLLEGKDWMKKKLTEAEAE
ncbi:dicarboxylate/amino acid:cation symporter [Thermotoga caldifontis]|uniref:dicarboxylate/amino acid:cation symporter n=1 Tax=Thermotoga caldifontis TaxID=1508419 RepID=UPI0005976D5C|nr:dicarboxylate/amino acid:cation symporter [Thermotoga caldifontis]